MSLRITRNGPVDLTPGTTVYTVPAGQTATINGINFINSKNANVLTVSHLVGATGVTTTLYTRDLQPYDNMSDTGPYALAADDALIIQASAAGMTYTSFIDIP